MDLPLIQCVMPFFTRCIYRKTNRCFILFNSFSYFIRTPSSNGEAFWLIWVERIFSEYLLKIQKWKEYQLHFMHRQCLWFYFSSPWLEISWETRHENLLIFSFVVGLSCQKLNYPSPTGWSSVSYFLDKL